MSPPRGFGGMAASPPQAPASSRMLRIEFKNQPYDWFNLDDMGDVVRSDDFANTLRENIVHYFTVPYDCQAIYDEEGLLNAPVDFIRSLQRNAPYFRVYDVREMPLEEKEQALRKLRQVADAVSESQRMFTTYGVRPSSGISGGASATAAPAWDSVGGGDTGGAANGPVPSPRRPSVAASSAREAGAFSIGPLAEQQRLPAQPAQGASGGGVSAYTFGQQRQTQQRQYLSQQPQQQPLLPGIVRSNSGCFGAESGWQQEVPRYGGEAPRAHSAGPAGAAVAAAYGDGATGHGAAYSSAAGGTRTPPYGGDRAMTPPSSAYVGSLGGGGGGAVTPPTGGGMVGAPNGAGGFGLRGHGLGQSGLEGYPASSGNAGFLGNGILGDRGGTGGGGFGGPVAVPAASSGSNGGCAFGGGGGSAVCISSGGSVGHTGSASVPTYESYRSRRGVQDGFEVSLRKSEQSERFGFANVPSADGRSLLVTWVDPNKLLGEWNRLYPERMVREGDVIMDVNGLSNDAEAMRAQLQLVAVQMVILSGGGSPRGGSRLTRA